MGSLFLYTLILISISQTCFSQERPEWISQPNRVVLGGDILHWGGSRDVSEQVAMFKAKQMAIKSLLQECGGIAHKDIVPWDNYVERLDNGEFTVYARVGLSFESCQEAKGPNAKKYENKEIAESQKLYSKLLSADMGLLEPSEKEKIMEEVIKEAQDQYNSNAGHLEDRIRQLEAKLNAMKAPQVVLPARLPATSSMKIACLKRLQQMEHILQMKAPANGNFADPSVADDYNRYQIEASICESYK